MKYIVYGVIGLAVLGYLLMNDKGRGNVNLTQVLQRSALAMENYDKYLKKNNIEKATDKHLEQLNKYLQTALNRPPLQEGLLVATSLGKDAKFTGVTDANKNGFADPDEKKLFTLEIDGQNKRLIATGSDGTGTSRGFSGMGFVAGALIGSMLGRQRSAGINPSSFSNRKLTSPAAYNAARSRARSGGLRRGK
jgi:hypothetical protein